MNNRSGSRMDMPRVRASVRREGGVRQKQPPAPAPADAPCDAHHGSLLARVQHLYANVRTTFTK